jgi:hypothetical protein
MKNKITSASISIAIAIVTVTTIYLSAVGAQSRSQVSARRDVDNTEGFDPAASYRLTTEWQGKVKSLDVRNDNYQLVLVDVGNYSGQLWKISPVGNGYYRFTNQWRGNQSLDIDNNGHNDNRVVLADTGYYSGQMWSITPAGQGTYRLTTRWQGDAKSLDLIDAGNNTVEPAMATTGNYSGQLWRITKVQ